MIHVRRRSRAPELREPRPLPAYHEIEHAGDILAADHGVRLADVALSETAIEQMYDRWVARGCGD